MDYIPRIADTLLREQLASLGAVAIEGPRSSGKTETAAHQARSAVRLDVDANARALAEVEPALLLEGDQPRLIDEWQEFPRLWDHVRRAVDDSRGRPGQFILTGSSMPADDARSHTGAGRISRLRMRTLSLFESGFSSGGVSIRRLLDGSQVAAAGSDRSIRDYAEQIVRGGWPASIRQSPRVAEQYARAYARNAMDTDIPALGGKPRNPASLQRFFTAYAQLTGSPVSISAVVKRAFAAEGGITDETAQRYREAAERLMLIEDLPAWSPALRSRTRLVSTPKRFFVDPSLAAAYLGVDAAGLLADLNTMGFLFENLALRDLRCYADALDCMMSHYRESNGELEADMVLSTRSGEWIAFEVKMGASRIDEAAAALTKLRDRRVESPPAALVVVTMKGGAYQRPDGVWVVPLNLLGP